MYALYRRQASLQNNFKCSIPGYACYTAEDAHLTYQRLGISSYCLGGTGGLWAMDVYEVTGSYAMIRSTLVLQGP